MGYEPIESLEEGIRSAVEVSFLRPTPSEIKKSERERLKTLFAFLFALPTQWYKQDEERTLRRQRESSERKQS